jgi:hypothetical protein
MIYIYNTYIYMIFYDILWISMNFYDYLWLCCDIMIYIQIMDMYGLWYVWLCDDMCTNVRICAYIYINHVWFDWIWLNDVFPCHNLIVDVQLCITPEHVLRSPCILYSRPMDDPGVWRVYMAPCPLHRGPHWQPLVDPPSYLGIVEPCRTLC